MKKDKKHGFTLVELICVILITGLLLTMGVIGVTRMIENSKVSGKLAQEKLINNACQSYIDDNKDKAPKAIGDTVNIKLSTLYDKKYITEEIKNSNNESCMENSYVRVYKLDKSNYKYLTYVYCGNEVKPKIEEIPSPNIRLLFIDDKTITNNNSIFNDIKQTRVYLDIDGGNTFAGAPIEIDYYTLSISMKTKTNPVLKEYYNSGIKDMTGNYTFELDKKLNYFVNAEDATTIVIKVKAVNSQGGVKEIITKAELNNN